MGILDPQVLSRIKQDSKVKHLAGAGTHHQSPPVPTSYHVALMQAEAE